MVVEVVSGAVGGILLVLGAKDYKTAKDIRRDYKPLIDNPDKTKLVAVAAKQDLENNYKTFGRFNGLLTSITKLKYSRALDRMMSKEEKEFSKENKGLTPKVNFSRPFIRE